RHGDLGDTGTLGMGCVGTRRGEDMGTRGPLGSGGSRGTWGPRG
ncbi:hypothetical protein Anapl_16840, partial [Anas platyrhynchos]